MSMSMFRVFAPDEFYEIFIDTPLFEL